MENDTFKKIEKKKNDSVNRLNVKKYIYKCI